MIDVTPDKLHWERHLREKFARLQRRLDGGMENVSRQVAASAPDVVNAGRRRPSVGRSVLSEAIKQSIRPVRGGTGVVVGDRAVLDHLAPYWHAIEVGSDHIIGVRLTAFTGPEGGQQPAGSRFRRESKAFVRAQDARDMGLPVRRAIVQRPIRPHGYLGTLGQMALLSAGEETNARLKEAFEGVPYKRSLTRVR